MAEEGESEGVASAWSRVSVHIEEAIAAIPQPPYQITSPQEVARQLKKLIKQLQPRLEELLLVEERRPVSVRIYGLLEVLVNRITDVCKAFYEYISDKVKRFLNWVSGLMQNLRQRLKRQD
eukprot:c34689_g1_i1 orf=76-438(+)